MRENNRDILRLACPAIVTNITTPLLGLMDTAIAGHLGSARYIAAIAVGATIFNMIYWLLGFLRMGTSGMTAQAWGGARKAEEASILRAALLTAATAGALILALSVPIEALSLALLEPDSATRPIVSEYFHIVVWGAPAVLMTYAMTGWLLGMQNSRAGMWMSITINVANIGVSMVLVIGLVMGMRGVAIGTLSAQWLGVVVGGFFCRSELRSLGSNAPQRLRDILQLLPRFFGVNIYIFLRTLGLVAVTVWFTRAGAVQGTVILAVNALLMQLFILFSYFMDGFAYAGEALAGRYVGASDGAGLRSVVKALMRWGIGLALIFGALYFSAGEAILRLLSNDATVVAASRDYLLWIATVPLVGFGAFVWDGIYIGATATARMAVSVGVSAAVFFAVYALLYPTLGNHALWLAFCLYLLSRGVVQTALSRKIVRFDKK